MSGRDPEAFSGRCCGAALSTCNSSSGRRALRLRNRRLSLSGRPSREGFPWCRERAESKEFDSCSDCSEMPCDRMRRPLHMRHGLPRFPGAVGSGIRRVVRRTGRLLKSPVARQDGFVV